MRGEVRCGVARCLALWVCASWAWAGPLESRLSGHEQEAHQWVQESGRLLRRVQQSDQDFLTQQQAVQRYEEGVYRHLIGDYGLAAESFFALVTTRALEGTDLEWDAQWLLAEALFELGNWLTAEERYVAMVDQEGHPFRDDAVRRLLEIFSRNGDSESFYQYYDREIMAGKVEPSARINFSLARSFHEQGDRVRARETFRSVQGEPIWVAKAQYWLGAYAVEDGDLEGAAPYFDEVTRLETEGQVARDLVDLGHLALARLHYEKGELEEAVLRYDRVGVDSTYLADKLYELVWTAIRGEDWQLALQGIDDFLRAFPEHEYVAALRLTGGNLHMQLATTGAPYQREGAFEGALDAYGTIVEDYEPVRDRFGLLASSNSSGRDYFSQIVMLEGEEAGEAEGLPGYALAMMRADPELSRAIEVMRALEEQEADLALSEQMVRELTAYLENSSTIASFVRLRSDWMDARYGVLMSQAGFLESEERWLLEGGASGKERVQDLTPTREAIEARIDSIMGRADAAREALLAHERELEVVRALVLDGVYAVSGHSREVDELRALLESAPSLDPEVRTILIDDLGFLRKDMAEVRETLDDLGVRLAGIGMPHVADQASPAEIQTLIQDIAKLHERYTGLRHSMVGPSADRFDGVQNAMVLSHTQLDEVERSLSDIQSSELGRVRERFEYEAEQVAAERALMNVTYAKAGLVAGVLTRDGFERLEGFFANSVLNADVGMVDVYWARKIQVDDEIRSVREERQLLLAQLERRLELIRLKAGE